MPSTIMPVKHELWLWLWFFIGMMMYWLKRAYYLVTGPNPVANTYVQFWFRCWAPLLVRFFLDSLVFWMMFTPGVVAKGLAYMGWINYAWVVDAVTQYAVFASVFGHTVDSIMDFAVSKVPLINGILPQMPGPLPQANNP